ncbi:hypothetical protein D3C81_1848010 [compost metagenome]
MVVAGLTILHHIDFFYAGRSQHISHFAVKPDALAHHDNFAVIVVGGQHQAVIEHLDDFHH